MSPEKKLGEFLMEFAEKPVTWGLDDCCAAPALWVARATGTPLDYPVYDSHEEAYALIEGTKGGLIGLWEDVLAPVGLRVTDRPKLGDIGIVMMGEVPQRGCIFANDGIAYFRRYDAGWHPLRPRPRTILKVWSVC